jgi:hypothetical protein
MDMRIKMLMVSQKENIATTTIPAAPHDGSDLLAARAVCSEIRQALDGIQTHAANGARDLRDGLSWSLNLEQFESASMEQVRTLARFPISAKDGRFGALVHRARAAVVAFRETVRREIIGTIDCGTDDAAYDLALNKVAGRSALAAESLTSVEQAITQYWSPISAPLRVNDTHPRICGATGR